MARTKSMLDLFQPVDINFDLKTDRPYFEIDGARTYLITEDGELSQNAVAALVHARAEYQKYKKFFTKLHEKEIELVHSGVSVQEGDYPAGPGTKETSANAHAKVLAELVEVLFADKPEAKAAIEERYTEKRTKKVILVNGEPIT